MATPRRVRSTMRATRRRVAPVLIVAIAVAVASSCSDARDDAEPPAKPATTSDPGVIGSPSSAAGSGPEGEAFYQPPDPLPAGAPGELIWSSPLKARSGARVWKILYHSRTVDDRDVAISGLLVSPTNASPAKPRPVVAIAPGATGLADDCSQSKRADDLLTSPIVQRLIDSGHVIVATDYLGLGTPGLHPFGVGESGGRNLLDAARAATHLPEAGAGTRIVLYGHSMGGHSAFFAGGLAGTYAPELEVLGVVAAAPPSGLAGLTTNASAAPGALGWVVMFVRGFGAAYPELDVNLVLTEAARSASVVVERACAGGVLRAFASQTKADVLVSVPADVPAWREVLDRNSLGPGRVVAPVLLLKGDADELLPKPFTDLFAERLCTGGDNLDYRVYAGASHDGVVDAAADDARAWISDRFGGAPASSNCPGR